jgi:trans-aconitate methyltransferase
MIKQKLFENFAHPEGMLGHLAGRIMAKKKSNTARGLWAVNELAPEPSDRVLEVGYGPGVALEAMGQLVTAGSLVGVDSSDVMKSQASKRNSDLLRNGRLVLHVGDAQALDPTLKDFDLIYGFNVWQFWSDQSATVAALASRLSSGGRLALLYMQPPSGTTTGDQAQGKLVQQFQDAGLANTEIRIMDFEPPAVMAIGTRL